MRLGVERGCTDDTAAGVNPGAAEVCADGVDNDCDGATDDAATGATGTLYYTDADGDGYGDPATAVVPCDPTGLLADGTDCDDTDETVNPAAREVCADGIDNDCDGAIELPVDGSGTYTTAACDVRTYGQTQDGYYGTSVAAGSDFDGDGLGDLAVGEPGSDYHHNNAGEAWVYTGGLTIGGWAGDTHEYAEITESVSSQTRVGTRIYGFPDGNDDGLDDLLVSRAADALGVGLLDLVPGTSSWLSLVSGTGVSCGVAVASAELYYDSGDYHELLCGAGNGGVTTFFGAGYGPSYLFEGDYVWRVVERSSELGTSVAAADIDGDGIAESWLGDPAYGASDVGAIYRIPGDYYRSRTESDLATASDAMFSGVTAGDRVGESLLAPGDLDGDGYDDLLVGGDSTVWIVSGAAVTGTTSVVTDYSLATIENLGSSTTMENRGDLDCDGNVDVLFTASGADTSASVTAGGVAWVAYGPFTGALDLAADYGVRVEGTEDNQALGYSGVIGDVSGDGCDDLVLGARGEAYGSATGAGAVYVYLGG